MMINRQLASLEIRPVTATIAIAGSDSTMHQCFNIHTYLLTKDCFL